MSSGQHSEGGVQDETWIDWFCSLGGNNFYCTVDRSFMEDQFNLFGLSNYMPEQYSFAMNLLLDKLDDNDDLGIEIISRSAASLYGLIHARYILTTKGLEKMLKKYKNKDFGECPRSYCRSQAVLPVGITDEPKRSCVKLYCPRCKDVYNCPSAYKHIDGAYFGATFPHLLLMTYDSEKVSDPVEEYTPRIFGFRIHKATDNSAKEQKATTGSGNTPAVVSSCSSLNHQESTQGRQQQSVVARKNGSGSAVCLKRSANAIDLSVVEKQHSNLLPNTNSKKAHCSDDVNFIDNAVGNGGESGAQEEDEVFAFLLSEDSRPASLR